MATFPDDDMIDYDDPLQAFKAVSDPDRLYYHEAMREEDNEHFKTSMLKELTEQIENGNLTVVHKYEVPNGSTTLPVVWHMERKRDAKTGATKKRKARQNINGSWMKKGEHNDMTYSPVIYTRPKAVIFSIQILYVRQNIVLLALLGDAHYCVLN